MSRPAYTMTKHAPHAPGFSHEVRERSIYFVDVQHFSAIMGAVSEMEHQVISSLVLSARLRVPVDVSRLETQGSLLRPKAASVAPERKSHSPCEYIAVRIVVFAPSSEIYSPHSCGDILG